MAIYAKKISAEQGAWLKTYEDATGFEPLNQDELDSGEMTFVEVARQNIRWFEQFANDALLRIGNVPGQAEAMDAELDAKG
ncbi:hypothetical protein RBU55_00030 [Pseudomonas chlororaphis subsp. aurantiaca]|uniref:hypothetical protein n=1 Tax=Pseudomonas chlororaphis TaxID=587753 RepID=UPI0027DAF2D8|nr:hypothetical protein [Pseudomonas chlororaphis]WMI99976.1 hypothetical protein RBU55_00030 [Pseudomonas chlororaphis subsp. aurantiaca]